MKTKKKGNWKDMSEPVRYPARHAICPNCGKVGLRSVIVGTHHKIPKCYRWQHGRKPSFMPGVFESIECIVSFEKAGSRP